MKNKKIHVLGYGLLAVSITIIVIAFINTDIDLGLETFNIPIPFALAKTGAGEGQDSIKCDIWHVTHAINNQGKTIKVIKSNIISGSPTLSLVDKTTNDMIAGYGVIPQIICTNTFDSTKSNLDLTIVIESGSLQLRVLSSHPNSGQKTTTVIKNLVTEELEFKPNEEKKNLGAFSVSAKDIAEDLPSNIDGKSWESEQEFRIKGVLNVHWKEYPNIKYKLPIGIADIVSKHTIIINPDGSTGVANESNDSDGDGIIDVYDQCIAEPETYNGYDDSDGCSDTNPTVPKQTEEDVSGNTHISTTPNISDMNCRNDSNGIGTFCTDRNGGQWIFDNTSSEMCNAFLSIECLIVGNLNSMLLIGGGILFLGIVFVSIRRR